MGNQLLKGYNIQGQPISCVGCQKMWRIYQGTKTSTGQPATIFALQKRALNKSERQQLIKFAKKQAMGLTRIRHPGVLAISQTLIEDEHILAFSTQPILGNLTMLVKQNKLREIISNQIQLRLNLFPLLDTVQFLHDNVKTVHLGLNFDNIYITKQGKWKIGGFSNSQVFIADQLQDISDYRCADYSYSPPELVVQKKFEKKSDVYSLGVLILNLLLVLCGQYQQKSFTSASDYQQNFEKVLIGKVNNSKLQKTQNYKQLKVLLKSVFSRHPSKRLSLNQLINSKWLNDKLVLTVKYLQNITNYDNKQQTEFLKGLMGIMNHFQGKILLRKVIPLLMGLLKFKHLIPSVIYISIQIVKNGKIIKNAQFLEHIWPHLKKVVLGKQITAHSLFMLVQNMVLLQKIVNLEQMTQTIIPLYIKCFDCPPKLKILALHQTDYILTKMDYQFVKAKLLPKILNCMKDNNFQIHKKSLIALKKCIKIVDVQTIISQVLPSLQHSRRSGADPFINAITISIYGQLAKTLPTQALSSKLIPTILPYLTDPSVTAHDFYNYKATLNTMIEKIQNERKKFWDETKQQRIQNFTQTDFDFKQDQIKVQQKQSNIGKGDYNFLSNYQTNLPQQRNNQEIQQPFSNESRQPAQNMPSFAQSFGNINNNNPMGFSEAPVQNKPQPRKVQQPKNDPISFDFDNNFGSGNDNKSTMNSFSSQATYNKPFSPESNFSSNTYNPPTQNLNNPNQQGPKLKGPGQKRPMRGPPPPEKYNYNPDNNPKSNKNIDYSDPWSALDNVDISPTENFSTKVKVQSSKDMYNFQGYGINTNTKKQQTWTSTGNMQNYANKTNNQSKYMNFGSNNYDPNDPFADISGPSQNSNMNIGMGNNNNYGNNNYNNNYANSNTNNLNSYGMGNNDTAYDLGGFGSSNQSQNNKTGGDLGGFDYGNSWGQPALQQKPAKKPQQNTGFDFDLI